jgi:hypothetical protein
VVLWLRVRRVFRVIDRAADLARCRGMMGHTLSKVITASNLHKGPFG